MSAWIVPPPTPAELAARDIAVIRQANAEQAAALAEAARQAEVDQMVAEAGAWVFSAEALEALTVLSELWSDGLVSRGYSLAQLAKAGRLAEHALLHGGSWLNDRAERP